MTSLGEAPVADEVSQAEVMVDPLLLDEFEDRVESIHIAVDVREHEVAHRLQVLPLAEAYSLSAWNELRTSGPATTSAKPKSSAIVRNSSNSLGE